MKIHDIRLPKGAKKRRKIIGRGQGSGHGGHQSTRGDNGQRSRTGFGGMVSFEGGQMPLIRRLPKRGFNNRYRKEFAQINLDRLSEFFNSDSEINPEVLLKRKIIKGNLPIKILARGEVNKPLKVKAHAFSKTAIEKIEKAGGSVELI